MIHALVGRRTVGKTTLADYLCGSCDYQFRFSPRVTLPDRGVQASRYERDPDDWATLSATAQARGCYTVVPSDQVDETFLAYARDLRGWCQEHEHTLRTERRSMGVLVDEARFPAVRESRDLDWLFRCAPQDLVHVYLTVHRPKDLHPDIRAIVDRWYVFHVTQPKDLEVIGDECSALVARLAERLPPREFLAFNMASQKMRHWRADQSVEWQPKAAPRDPVNVTTNADRLEAGGDEDFELL